MIYGVSNNDGTDNDDFHRYSDDNVLTETILEDIVITFKSR